MGARGPGDGVFGLVVAELPQRVRVGPAAEDNGLGTDVEALARHAIENTDAGRTPDHRVADASTPRRRQPRARRRRSRRRPVRARAKCSEPGVRPSTRWPGTLLVAHGALVARVLGRCDGHSPWIPELF